jgi:hypothetical protein
MPLLTKIVLLKNHCCGLRHRRKLIHLKNIEHVLSACSVLGIRRTWCVQKAGLKPS